MSKGKNTNAIIILYTVIIIILTVLITLLLTDTIKLNFKHGENNQTNNANLNNVNNVDNSNKDEISTLPEWAEYLLSQNIDSITIYNRTCTIEDDGIHSSSEELTTEQFKTILIEVAKGELKKHRTAGFGGPCLKSIVVKYNDDKEFELILYKFIRIKSIDEELATLLEKENYTYDELNIDAINSDEIFEYDWDTSYIDTLFQK